MPLCWRIVDICCPPQVALAQTLYDGGYKYMLMPDHAPTHPDDTPIPGGRRREFCHSAARPLFL